MHKLYIHIGAGKCGSTAIQQFLRRNAAKLVESGILIPSANLSFEGNIFGNQIWVFENLLKRKLGEARNVVQKRLKALKDHMDKSGFHTMVISAENLSNPVGFEKLFSGCNELFEVKIVFYIRRQDDYLLSAWQQWGLKISESFDSWLSNDTWWLSNGTWFPKKCLWGNWHECLLPWEKMFGCENVVLKRYAPDKLIDGDVVKDFCVSCGFFTNEIFVDKPAANRSFNDIVTRLAYDANDLFTGIHDNRLYEMFRRFGGPSVYKNRKGSSLLTLEKRMKILKTFESGNARLKKDYFTDEQGQLFDPPSEKDVYHMTEKQITDEKIACLTRTLFGVHNHIVKMERETSKP